VEQSGAGGLVHADNGIRVDDLDALGYAGVATELGLKPSLVSDQQYSHAEPLGSADRARDGGLGREIATHGIQGY
jgi:hypothetical protein